jgi:hypothetical protein
MIILNRYAQGARVLSLDYSTEAELSQIRENFVWAQSQTRLGLKGSIAKCLSEADDKFSPQYLSVLISKVRQATCIKDLSAEVLEAVAEVAESIGYGNLAANLDSILESKKKK